MEEKDRLTRKDKKGFINIKLDKPVTLPEIRSYAEDLAFNKLFDYEDTNLSPAEIETLKAENSNYKKTIQLCCESEALLNEEIRRLKEELSKVKTPYEIGQILYFIYKKLPAINLTTGGIEEMFEHSWEISKVKIGNIYICKNKKGCLEYEYCDKEGNFIDINTMYTSREAAENRLKELKEIKE